MQYHSYRQKSNKHENTSLKSPQRYARHMHQEGRRPACREKTTHGTNRRPRFSNTDTDCCFDVWQARYTAYPAMSKEQLAREQDFTDWFVETSLPYQIVDGPASRKSVRGWILNSLFQVKLLHFYRTTLCKHGICHCIDTIFGYIQYTELKFGISGSTPYSPKFCRHHVHVQSSGLWPSLSLAYSPIFHQMFQMACNT